MAAWLQIIWLARILWVCRVSLISALTGLVVLGFVEQARNVLADVAWESRADHGWGFWATAFIVVIVVWAFPVHYAARRALDDPAWLASRRVRDEISGPELERLRAQHAWKIRWVPRLLGLVPFIAIAVGACRDGSALNNAEALDTVGQTQTHLKWLLTLDAVTAVVFLVVVLSRKPLIARVSARMRTRALRHGQHADPDRFFARFAWICFAITAAISFAAYFAPVVLASYFARAIMLPILFGAPVLTLAFIARLSHRTGAPLVTLALLAAAGITALDVSLNDLRTMRVRADDASPRQIEWADAIRKWKTANDCEGKSACPPVLIVAADGGGSRAAFMTAATIGALFDRAGELRDARPNDPMQSPARRIFAMSGVSGGAVGLTAIRAALSDAADNGGRIPCGRRDRTYYRFDRQSDGLQQWRECFEALTSGDFLSPVIVGLALRDNFAPFSVITDKWKLEDRAALIEQAFERHYDYVTCSGAPVCDTKLEWLKVGNKCPVTPTDAVSDGKMRGVCRHFGYSGKTPAGWSPPLALNATSVQTGRRVVFSDLAPVLQQPPGSGWDALHQEAYDFFEVTATPCGTPNRDGSACAPNDASGANIATAERS